MRLAVVGLGRMGMGIARRLIADGHEVAAYDIDPDVMRQAEAVGATGATSLEEAVSSLRSAQRFVWTTLPAGDQLASTLQTLAVLLGEGDIIVEGSSAYYKESMERAARLSYKGIHMLDVGVSGGGSGEEQGFNLMVGGDQGAFDAAVPLFEAVAPPGGFQLVGPSGAGHFAKLALNGIEVGIMQSIAEGFELMAAKSDFELDLAAVARLWNNGSTIRSWLIELAGKALEDDPDLDWVETDVDDAGEGRWAAQEALDLEVPLPIIALSLQMGFRSRQKESFGARLLAALRTRFAGEAVHHGSGG